MKKEKKKTCQLFKSLQTALAMTNSTSPLMFQEINAQGVAISPDLWTEEEALIIAKDGKATFVQVVEGKPQGSQMVNRFFRFENGLGYPCA